MSLIEIPLLSILNNEAIKGLTLFSMNNTSNIKYESFVSYLAQYNTWSIGPKQEFLKRLDNYIKELTLFKRYLINSIEFNYNSVIELINSKYNNFEFIFFNRNHNLFVIENELFISRVQLIKFNNNNKTIDENENDLIALLTEKVNSKLNIINKENTNDPNLDSPATITEGSPIKTEEVVEVDKINLVTLLSIPGLNRSHAFVVVLRPLHVDERLLPNLDKLNDLFDTVDNVVFGFTATSNAVNPPVI